ncbi:hypothetical protein KIPB_004890 [Kipferlia bialata]|uniref:MIT domain-containing protein n=1 Tax=Kipferlia bialata TaxID=797122 RepID=A0A9K3GI39_9EUKA|nr:hypothetical protein KIPB_004890 [Kipferlia bialata]|eukprot:g4890.t1
MSAAKVTVFSKLSDGQQQAFYTFFVEKNIRFVRNNDGNYIATIVVPKKGGERAQASKQEPRARTPPTSSRNDRKPQGSASRGSKQRMGSPVPGARRRAVSRAAGDSRGGARGSLAERSRQNRPVSRPASIRQSASQKDRRSVERRGTGGTGRSRIAQPRLGQKGSPHKSPRYGSLETPAPRRNSPYGQKAQRERDRERERERQRASDRVHNSGGRSRGASRGVERETEERALLKSRHTNRSLSSLSLSPSMSLSVTSAGVQAHEQSNLHEAAGQYAQALDHMNTLLSMPATDAETKREREWALQYYDKILSKLLKIRDGGIPITVPPHHSDTTPCVPVPAPFGYMGGVVVPPAYHAPVASAPTPATGTSLPIGSCGAYAYPGTISQAPVPTAPAAPVYTAPDVPYVCSTVGVSSPIPPPPVTEPHPLDPPPSVQSKADISKSDTQLHLSALSLSPALDAKFAAVCVRSAAEIATDTHPAKEETDDFQPFELLSPEDAALFDKVCSRSVTELPSDPSLQAGSDRPSGGHHTAQSSTHRGVSSTHGHGVTPRKRREKSEHHGSGHPRSKTQPGRKGGRKPYVPEMEEPTTRTSIGHTTRGTRGTRTPRKRESGIGSSVPSHRVHRPDDPVVSSASVGRTPSDRRRRETVGGDATRREKERERGFRLATQITASTYTPRKKKTYTPRKTSSRTGHGSGGRGQEAD